MNESGSVCELGSKEWKHVNEKCTVECIIRKWEVGRVRVRMKCQCVDVSRRNTKLLYQQMQDRIEPGS